MKIIALLLILLACDDTNFFAPMAASSSDKVLLEKAQVLLDKKKYAEALLVLNDVETESNKKSELRAYSLVGSAGLDLWTLLLNLVNSSSSAVTMDTFLESLDGIFGTGDELTLKIAKLQEAINALESAPDPKAARIADLACFFSGVLSVPSVTQGQQSLIEATTALESVVASATNGGGSADDCPDLSGLESASTNLSTTVKSFKLILDSVAGCGFIDLDAVAGSLSAVEERLSKFVNNGDQGCLSSPSCGSSIACQALSLGCVTEVIDDGTSVSGDGAVSSCEFLQNCLTGTCF